MSNKCGKCKNTVRVNQKGLECDGCSIWWHITCEKTSESYFKLINDREPNMNNVKWFCSSCLPALSQFDQIKQTQAKLDNQMTNLESMMRRLEKREEEFDKRVENIENLIEQKVNERFDERVAKESRKTNIIIHGLKESKKNDPKARKDEDLKEVQQIAAALNASVKVSGCIRLGARQEKVKRPLKVELKTVGEKVALLKASRGLRSVKKYEKVFINPDLTPKERENDKKIIKQLKETRKKNPNKRFKISQGKIVEVKGQRTRQEAGDDDNENDEASDDAGTSSDSDDDGEKAKK